MTPASASEAATRLAATARSAAVVLHGSLDDDHALLKRLRKARIVLIGEASHGTHEFYRIRADITKQLVERLGFSAVAVEADWPDADRVNRYVHGRGDDHDAEEALRGFVRFPAWMWRNTDVLDFVGWLRDFNDRQPPGGQTGFYGLDLYSLIASIEAVVAYLDAIDPHAAARARARYACFDHFGGDTQAYGYAASAGMAESCEAAVVEQLVDLRRRAAAYALRDGRVAAEAFFSAEQNARLAANAEQYYRAMFRGRVSSWNLRDTHMADTLAEILTFLGRYRRSPKVVLWAHNSHLGDARATEMGAAGELNVGQLVRQRFPGEVVSIGFTTYEGTVTAASDWGGVAERKRVRPGLPGSIEAVMHEVGLPRFMLDLADPALAALAEPRLERAIGVIYRPGTERQSHYFATRVRDQFDVLIHVDHTRALEPLERGSVWDAGEAPETYPTGM
jgi:erythromycin esterase-like protein